MPNSEFEHTKKLLKSWCFYVPKQQLVFANTSCKLKFAFCWKSSLNSKFFRKDFAHHSAGVTGEGRGKDPHLPLSFPVSPFPLPSLVTPATQTTVHMHVSLVTLHIFTNAGDLIKPYETCTYFTGFSMWKLEKQIIQVLHFDTQ